MKISKEKYDENKKILSARVKAPLEWKVEHTAEMIKEFAINTGGAYISFSGGLGSRVLLDINKRFVNTAYQLPSLYVDTGLDHKGVKAIATKYADYVTRGNMNFKDVLLKYGYPVISKSQAMAIKKLREYNLSDKYRDKLLHGDDRGTAGKLSEQNKYLLNADFRISGECCLVLKERPAKKWERENENICPVTAEMVEESANRKFLYLQYGCNMYDLSRPKSVPMSPWTQENLLQYVKMYNIDYAPEYGEIKEDDFGHLYNTGEQRTGCAFCLFGCHREKCPNRIQRLHDLDKRRYEYCTGGGEYNSQGIWIPNKQGLGLGHIMDFMGIEWRKSGSIKTENNGQLKIV